MKHCTKIFMLTMTAAWLYSAGPLYAADGTIKLGLLSGFTGPTSFYGESTERGAELAKKVIDAKGGIKIGGKTYSLAFVKGDTGGTRTGASNGAFQLASKEEVLGVIGPQTSDRAIVASAVLNGLKVPMISPTSTMPATTANKPYAFRIPALYDMQAKVAAELATKNLKAKKAALLYNENNTFTAGVAVLFKRYFEEINGPNSVVTTQTMLTADKDYSRQLAKIIQSNADFLFVPQFINEVSIIVKQAKAMGWKKPIVGASSWATGDLLGQCGEDCKGLYFAGNFAAASAEGAGKQLVEQYRATYNKQPDESVALTYDAVMLMVAALERMDELSGHLVHDREKLRDQIAATKNFQGITGQLSYQYNGDPFKCAIMVKIEQDGGYTNQGQACPEKK